MSTSLLLSPVCECAFLSFAFYSKQIFGFLYKNEFSNVQINKLLVRYICISFFNLFHPLTEEKAINIYSFSSTTMHCNPLIEILSPFTDCLIWPDYSWLCIFTAPPLVELLTFFRGVLANELWAIICGTIRRQSAEQTKPERNANKDTSFFLSFRVLACVKLCDSGVEGVTRCRLCCFNLTLLAVESELKVRIPSVSTLKRPFSGDDIPPIFHPYVVSS